MRSHSAHIEIISRDTKYIPNRAKPTQKTKWRDAEKRACRCDCRKGTLCVRACVDALSVITPKRNQQPRKRTRRAVARAWAKRNWSRIGDMVAHRASVPLSARGLTPLCKLVLTLTEIRSNLANSRACSYCTSMHRCPRNCSREMRGERPRCLPDRLGPIFGAIFFAMPFCFLSSAKPSICI